MCKNSEKFLNKKDRSIYLIQYLALTQACLKVRYYIYWMTRVPFFVKNYERTGVWAINRAPAKLVGLWEEEQTRASSICSANSYDKRIATSERTSGVKKLLNGGSIASAWRNSYDRSKTSGRIKKHHRRRRPKVRLFFE